MSEKCRWPTCDCTSVVCPKERKFVEGGAVEIMTAPAAPFGVIAPEGFPADEWIEFRTLALAEEFASGMKYVMGRWNWWPCDISKPMRVHLETHRLYFREKPL